VCVCVCVETEEDVAGEKVDRFKGSEGVSRV
jgi:hypothetical protein